jgi:uncharacterized delta-60 repeat protein
MRKWILYLIVVSIMISIITGCSIFGGSSGSSFGGIGSGIGSGGGSGYSPAIGVLDTSFNPNGQTPGIVVHNNVTGVNSHDEGKSIYVDNNGNIYVTGYSNRGGNPDMVIWKYNSIGTLDSSFGNNGIIVHHNAAGGFAMDYGNSIYVDSNGNIYVTGHSWNGSNFDMVIWGCNSIGSIDGIVVHNNAAGGNSDDYGYSIYVDNTGNIYVTGSSMNRNSNFDMVIWKYNSSGSLDSSFNSTGTTPGIIVHHDAAGGDYHDGGTSIYVDNTGKIYVTGSSTNRNGNDDMVIWKYNRDGSLDTSFNRTGFVVHDNAAGGNSHDYGYSIYVDNTGNIYVTGRSWNSSGNYDMVIWKYNRDGSLDTSFNRTGFVVHDNAAGSYLNDSSDSGNSIYVDNAGRIYVTGFSTNSYGDSDMVIWRYNRDGTLDSSFGNNGIVLHHSAAGGLGSDGGYSMYVDSTGKIYVTGYSYNYLRNADMVIWKYK